MGITPRDIVLAGYSQGGNPTLEFIEGKHPGEFNIMRACVSAGPTI